MAFDRAPDPHARDLFINWVLSRDGQKLIIKTAQKTASLRRDVPDDTIPPQYRIDPKVEYYAPFADPNYIGHYTKVRKKLKQIMKDAGYN